MLGVTTCSIELGSHPGGVLQKPGLGQFGPRHLYLTFIRIGALYIGIGALVTNKTPLNWGYLLRVYLKEWEWETQPNGERVRWTLDQAVRVQKPWPGS